MQISRVFQSFISCLKIAFCQQVAGKASMKNAAGRCTPYASVMATFFSVLCIAGAVLFVLTVSQPAMADDVTAENAALAEIPAVPQVAQEDGHELPPPPPPAPVSTAPGEVSPAPATLSSPKAEPAENADSSSLAVAQQTPLLPSAEIPLMRQISTDYDIMVSRHEAHKSVLNQLSEHAAYLEKIQSKDERLRYILFLEMSILNASSEIQVSEERHVEIFAKINSHRQSPSLLKQDETYLNFYSSKLQDMMKEREIIRQRLWKISNALRRELGNMPPPPVFTGFSGIRFVLVKGKKQQFYISEKPVSVLQFRRISAYGATGIKPVFQDSQAILDEQALTPMTNLNFFEARNFAESLSKWENAKFTLPTEENIKLLKTVEFKMENLAIWLYGLYGAPLKEQRLMKNFGISMVSIWDPQGCLRPVENGGEIVGELPQAHYSSLGMYIVAEPSTGKMALFNQLRRDIHTNGVKPGVAPAIEAPVLPDTSSTSQNVQENN